MWLLFDGAPNPNFCIPSQFVSWSAQPLEAPREAYVFALHDMWSTKARKMSMALFVNWASFVAKSFPRFEIRNLTDIYVYILNLSVWSFCHPIVHVLFVPNRYYIAMNFVCHQKSVIVSFFSLMKPLNRYRLMTWLNDAFLNVLQKSIIKVSLKYHGK